MEELTNRIKKRFAHLSKWAKRQSVTCFRVYSNDIQTYPLIIDWYDGDVVVWLYNRKKDETAEGVEAYRTAVVSCIQSALSIPERVITIKVRERQKGVSRQYAKLNQLKRQKLVAENGLSFHVNLSDYLDTGLFLDHRNTRQFVKERANQKRVLNLFAYTGTFTCYAIAGGATRTTTVDMNQNYLDWAKKNMLENGFEPSDRHQLINANCLAFIKHEIGKNRYDIIICDPPTFSNSKRMKQPFAIDTDYADLLKSCLKILSPTGVIVFSTNSRSFKLDLNQLPAGTVAVPLSLIPDDFKSTYSHVSWQIYRAR